MASIMASASSSIGINNEMAIMASMAKWRENNENNNMAIMASKKSGCVIIVIMA
jgi:hypothetical protein